MKDIDINSLAIVYYPDPVLRRVTTPVEHFDMSLAAIAARMLNLMREYKGVGLAAPQVGLGIRLFVFNVTGDPDDDCVCVNPQLQDLAGVCDSDEGCLSLPEVTVQMRRSESGRLRAQDLSGKWFERSGEGLIVRCWQHELDHLNGKLIIDNMSEGDQIANRRALKQLESKRKKAGAR